MIRNEPDAPRFLYQSSAVTLGGSFSSPYADALEAPAVALAVSGGFASARVEAFNYRNRVRCRSAHCEVNGIRVGAANVTSAEVVIQDLDVLGVLHAETIVARLRSTHENGESRIDPGGSRVIGLRIAGRPLDCALREELRKVLHYDGIASRAGGDEKLWRRSREERIPGGGPASREPMLATSLFEPRPGIEVRQGSSFLEVPDFGRVFIGEFLVSRHTRRLTMLRIQLGCPVEGELAVGDVSGNGHVFP
jgi:hypothetical protein